MQIRRKLTGMLIRSTPIRLLLENLLMEMIFLVRYQELRVKMWAPMILSKEHFQL